MSNLIALSKKSLNFTTIDPEKNRKKIKGYREDEELLENPKTIQSSNFSAVSQIP